MIMFCILFCVMLYSWFRTSQSSRQEEKWQFRPIDYTGTVILSTVFYCTLHFASDRFKLLSSLSVESSQEDKLQRFGQCHWEAVLSERAATRSGGADTIQRTSCFNLQEHGRDRS